MKTPPWKIAPPAATGASASDAPDSSHARSEGPRGEYHRPDSRACGVADHADVGVFFNGRCTPPHAATGDGMRSGAQRRDKLSRNPPASNGEGFGLICELQIFAAIVAFPTVLARFKALGVGPDIFAWPAIALLARFVMSWDRSDPLPVLREHADAMLDHLDGRGLNLGDELEDRVAILRACPTGDTWALRDLDRSLAALARRWLPAVLRHLADMHERGDTARAERLAVALVRLVSTTGGVA